MYITKDKFQANECHVSSYLSERIEMHLRFFLTTYTSQAVKMGGAK